MLRIRGTVLGCALALIGVGCASNRYVHKNGGAPVYDVGFRNNCSQYTAFLWFDDEYQNRRKIDVKARRVGTRVQRFKVPGGSHTFHAEWREVGGTRTHTGTFVVRRSEVFDMC